MILENGLLPNKESLRRATENGSRYNFLKYIVDVEKSVIFKYLD